MEIRLIAGSPTDASRHLVFVHGLTGTIQSTWSSNGTQGREFWPNWLAKDLTGTAIWLVGYPAPLTNWFSYAPALHVLADSLLNSMKIHSELAQGQIVFITHSLGGLVVKQLLIVAKSKAASDARAAELLARTEGVAFFGTPHRGSFLGNLAMLVKLVLRTSNATGAVMVGNDLLETIQTQYKALAREHRIHHLPLVEGRPLRIFGVTLPAMVVPRWSADSGVDEDAITLIDEDHKSICKLSDKNCAAYRYLLDFLAKEKLEPLPPGFDSPEWISGTEGLRARLRANKQTYVPAKQGPTVERLLAMLDDTSKPLAITGDGGLGKTRLALELYRASGRKGILIKNGAHRDDLKTLVTKARHENRKVFFLIDYIEEMGANYDVFHDIITRQAAGHATLVTTTRQLSSRTTSGGPQKLTEENCQTVDLNSVLLKPWRREACLAILAEAGVPDESVTGMAGLDEIDVPAIATLIAYDFIQHGIAENEKIRRNDGAWLLRRLRRNVNETLSNEAFVHLLSLYPFEGDLRESLPDELHQAADALERHGWVSRTHPSRGTGANTEWRLGHDLLCDIPLAELLLAEHKAPLRYELIARLAARAAELNSAQRFARALTRALGRLIAATPAPDILDTLEACAVPLAAGCPESIRTTAMCTMALNSFSLNLYEKLSVFSELPRMSTNDVTILQKTFDGEWEASRQFAKEQPRFIFQLCVDAALGNTARWLNLLLRSGLPASSSELMQPSAEITGALVPDFHCSTAPSDWRSAGFSRERPLPSVETATTHASVRKVQNRHPEFLSAMPDKNAIAALSADARLWIAKRALYLSILVSEYVDDPFPYDDVIDRFAEDDHPPVREQAANAAFNKAHVIAKRDSDPDAYNDVIDRFGGDDHPPVREQAANAAFGKAQAIANRDSDPSAYDDVINRFADDGHPPVRERAANAALSKAYEIANRYSDPSAYDVVINRFADDDHPPVRENAVSAAFNKAQAIANRDSDPSAYDDVIDRFAGDGHSLIRKRILSARAARIGWRVAVGQGVVALAEAGEFTEDTEADSKDKAVVTFLAWLAAPSPSRAARAQDMIGALGKEKVNWTFGEFAAVIDALPEGDRHFARNIIDRLETR